MTLLKPIVDAVTVAFKFLTSTFSGIYSLLGMITGFSQLLITYLAAMPAWISGFITVSISISVIFLILGRN